MNHPDQSQGSEHIFEGTDEILDSLQSTGDAYYHHSQLVPVIESLRSELAKKDEEIKQLREALNWITRNLDYSDTVEFSEKVNKARQLLDK
jgi:hypothetical protein